MKIGIKKKYKLRNRDMKIGIKKKYKLRNI